jgi:hypothetical protein
MKYSLTIASDDPNDLARIIAALGAGGTPVEASPAPLYTPPAPMPPLPGPAGAPAATDGDDDDGSPGDPNAPAFDSSGLPWDERIHSSSRKTGKDGTWNKRRGGPTGPALAAIEAELRARAAPPAQMPAPQPQYAPPPVAQPVPAPVPQYTPPMPVPAQQYAPPPVAQPAPLPVPVPQVTPAPAPTAQPTDFHSFMQGVGERTSKQMPDGSMMLHAEYLAQLAQRISQAVYRRHRPCGQSGPDRLYRSGYADGRALVSTG